MYGKPGSKDGGMLKAVRDRVQAEYDELSEKSCKLYVFMGSESFQILSEKHRELLEQQSNVMAEYGQIIQERLNLLDDEYTHGGAGEGQPVKGDTAKDGGRVLDEYCLSCGSRFDEAYMCACDIQESLSGCKACGGAGEVLAEECGVCRENY